MSGGEDAAVPLADEKSVDFAYENSSRDGKLDAVSGGNHWPLSEHSTEVTREHCTQVLSYHEGGHPLVAKPSHEVFGGYRLCPVHHDHSRPTFVYVFGLREHPELVKIGVAHHIEWRMEAIQNASPFTVEVVASARFCCKRSAHQNERHLHGLFRVQRIRGEWFRLDADEITSLKRTLQTVAVEAA